MLKKYSKKKIIISSACLLIVCAIAAGILYYMFKPEPGEDVILTKVFSGDIIQTLDATGTVESANQGVFTILDGTKVVNVNVRVGDRIKKGDILANFDIKSLDSLITSKQKAYDSAYNTYQSYKNSANNSKIDLAQVENNISKLETEISALEAKIAKAEEETTIKENTTTTTKTSIFPSLNDVLSSLFGDSVLSKLLNGDMTQSFDLSSLTGMSADQTKLTSLQLELLQLKAKQTLSKAQENGTLDSTLKKYYESALADLNSTKIAVQQLKNGWVAKDDGIIREVNIKAGEIYKNTSAVETKIDLSTLISLASTNSESSDLLAMLKSYLQPVSKGMIVEYYPFAASFILGKYDVLKVSMDQAAKITASNGSVFNGKITYISPVASSSSSINISSILGSSGGASSGVEAKVSIPHPDAGVIIGFDVDISIDVDKADNTTLVPAEAIKFDSDGSYVFLYNSDTKTVTRQKVETGIFSGSLYQIVSGCKVGDTIVKAPSLTLADGNKVTVKSTEDPEVTNTNQTTAVNTSTTVHSLQNTITK